MNISDKLDIISDTDVDNDDDSTKSDSPKKEENGDTKASTPEKVNSSDLKTVKMAMPQYNNEAVGTPTNGDKSKAASKLPKPSFRILQEYDAETKDAPERTSSYYRYIERPSDDLEDEVILRNVLYVVLNFKMDYHMIKHKP